MLFFIVLFPRRKWRSFGPSLWDTLLKFERKICSGLWVKFRRGTIFQKISREFGYGASRVAGVALTHPVVQGYTEIARQGCGVGQKLKDKKARNVPKSPPLPPSERSNKNPSYHVSHIIQSATPHPPPGLHQWMLGPSKGRRQRRWWWGKE